MSADIVKSVRGGLATSDYILRRRIMSHTIRNERTKGWLDKLALKRRTKKLIRDIKNEDFWMDWDEDYIPTAEI